MQKIYIEISDICGLNCSFCDTQKARRGVMDLELFKKATLEARKHTKLIALHILGDPLCVENLGDYLAIAKEANLGVEITTSGIYLSDFDLLLNPPIKQVNFSLDAIIELKNAESFLRKIFDFCAFKKKSDIFVNLRVQKRARNKPLVAILESEFGVENLVQNLFTPKQNRIKLGDKIIIDFRGIFAWDSNKNDDFSVEKTRKSHKISSDSAKDSVVFGTCLALKNHIGILSNGEIVPCCIDTQGRLSLGNIANSSIQSALQGKRARKMRESFSENVVYEAFCKSCDYRKRFMK